jgi:S1 RNA binding domain protein
VRDYVKEGDEVTIKVLRLGPKGRFELSLKQCDPDVAETIQQPMAVGAGASHRAEPRESVTFEDRLSRFLKDSEERMHDLKRHMESKRGRK